MYSNLLQVLPTIPKRYNWYVKAYVEKKSNHYPHRRVSGNPLVIPGTIPVTCTSCNFYSSSEKIGMSDSSALPSAQMTESSKNPKGCSEMSSMVDDFIDMLFTQYCYEDDTVGYSIQERILISLQNYYSIYDEQGPEEALKSVMTLTATNTLHVIFPHSHSRESLPKNRDPRFTDIIHMDEERINKAVHMYVALANQEKCIAVVTGMILAEYDVTVFALFFSELFHCMSCADPNRNISARRLNGPQLLFGKLEKHGYRNTLDWALQEIDSFSIMIDKLSTKLYLFKNLKQCKKQEIKTLLQIIFKYNVRYNEVRKETDQILSINPLFMPIFAILHFKKVMTS
jgi:hypothetical protein